MSLHYLVKYKTYLSDGRYIVSLETLVSLKKSELCYVALVAVKRAGCVVWQLECQASSVTASIHSDHHLNGYTLLIFLPLISRIIGHVVLKFSPCLNNPQPQDCKSSAQIDTWYTHFCIIPQMQ